MNVDRLEVAVLGTGLVKSIWFKAERDGVYTVMCRPAGETADDKFRTMASLAQLLVPRGGGGVLVAQQFVVKQGKLGYSWNISVFGEALLAEVESALAETRAELEETAPLSGHPVRPTNAPPSGSLIKVLRDTGSRAEGGVRIVSFPLPHVRSQDRNRPQKVEGSPLGYGKGAALSKGRS
jgi:hypothetical protein